ncbi:uncharacterized protein LOC120781649 [Bactrocera tryoni]|uniref:uncharacterized protein LOC120781649 n=1 Tax=Bactrocera tryoni TaxID=59916 RepID=UPI001A9633C1|nr:uncharacterized protein LOC120781649 [Bactrocera tryoni]
MARSSFLQPSQIIQRSVSMTEKHIRDYLPSRNAPKLKIRRQRNSLKCFKDPTCVEEIDIPLSLYVLEGQLFILSEKVIDGECILIFGTKSSLQSLNESDCWIMDGTFDVVPAMIRQLFSIHGRVEGQIVPLVFCLMTKKSKSMYISFFVELENFALNYGIQLNPTRIISDFEMAIISAARECFPFARQSGCLFPFGKIIWRKVQKEGQIWQQRAVFNPSTNA